MEVASVGAGQFGSVHDQPYLSPDVTSPVPIAQSEMRNDGGHHSHEWNLPRSAPFASTMAKTDPQRVTCLLSPLAPSSATRLTVVPLGKGALAVAAMALLGS